MVRLRRLEDVEEENIETEKRKNLLRWSPSGAGLVGAAARLRRVESGDMMDEGEKTQGGVFVGLPVRVGSRALRNQGRAICGIPSKQGVNMS